MTTIDSWGAHRRRLKSRLCSASSAPTLTSSDGRCDGFGASGPSRAATLVVGAAAHGSALLHQIARAAVGA